MFEVICGCVDMESFQIRVHDGISRVLSTMVFLRDGKPQGF